MKIDRILTGRYTAIPTFLLVMLLIFYLTFNVIGQRLSDWLQGGIDGLTFLVDQALTAYEINPVVHSLIIDGIFSGVGSVLVFLPIIVTLFFFLSILEDTGYMARVAFVMDKLLRRIGLSGRSIVPMLIGFGCSVPAIMATRTVSSDRDRKMTILLTPYMSCSAKISIYAFFTAAFFPQYGALVMIALYLLGILIGIACLKRGFTLKRSYEVSVSEGSVLPTVMAALLILVLTVPALFKASEAGPGSMHAPFWIALIVALVVGALAQKSRLCMVGGLRDAVMLGDFHLLYGFAAIFVVTLVGNLAMNRFNLGFALQPIAHSAHVWNLLGMVLVGWGSVLLGGCPLRQLILAAQGNGDSAVTVFGMIVGAALAHNFGLAGNPDSKNEAGQLVAGGISTAGKVAVIVGLVVLLVIALWNMPKKEAAK